MVVFVLVLILSILGGAGMAAAKDETTAVVTLSAAQESFSAAQEVVVRVTITNPNKNTIKVLKWFTPAEDVEESLFAVSIDGATVAYLGPTYKRPEPKGDDYIALKSGESFSRDVALDAYYDLSITGSYVARYDIAALDLYADEKGADKRAGSLSSNEITLKVEGRAAPQGGIITPDAVTGSTTYSKCTTTQQSTLVSARTQASSYATNALSYLQANKTGARYTTWFGVLDATRYSTVTTHFTKISQAMDTATVNFDCGCKKKYYAYVYPTQPYNIYVCSVFWTAPLTGTDSKAGTLIHEMSHFNVVASTDDFVYGQSGAKSLAISNPENAINNADNHEYFAENTPALP